MDSEYQHLSPLCPPNNLSIAMGSSELFNSPSLIPSTSPAPIIVTILTAVTCIVASTWALFLHRRRTLPPGPFSWPILGNLPDLAPLPYRAAASLAERYGPIMTVWFGSRPSVVISSPELAREVLKTEDRLCSGRPNTPTTDLLTFNGKNIAFSQPNTLWRQHRRILLNHLLVARHLQRSLAVREAEVRDMVNALAAEAARADAPRKATEAAAGGSAAEEGIEVRGHLNRATLNNIMRLTLDRHFSYKSIQNAEATSSVVLEEALNPDWIKDAAGRTRTRDGTEAEDDSTGDKVIALIEEGFAVAGAFNLGDWIPFLRPFDTQRIFARAKRLQPALHGFFQAAIAERKRLIMAGGTPRRVLVDFVFGETPEPGGGTGENDSGGADGVLADDDALMLVLDTVLAGTDTTGKTAEWALAELVRHPALLSRVQNEVDEAVKSAAAAGAAAEPEVATDAVTTTREENTVTTKDNCRAAPPPPLPVDKMPLLNALIKETLRHHPVVPFLLPHMTTGSVSLGGYTLPPKTLVQVNAWAIAHDPAVWPNPHQFQPERFLGGKGDATESDITPRQQGDAAPDITPGQRDFRALPFGAGRRGCVGSSLGMDLAARMVAGIVQRFDLNLPGEVKARGGPDMGEVCGLTMAMATPLRVVLKERA